MFILKPLFTGVLRIGDVFLTRGLGLSKKAVKVRAEVQLSRSGVWICLYFSDLLVFCVVVVPFLVVVDFSSLARILGRFYKLFPASLFLVWPFFFFFFFVCVCV